MCPHGLRRAAFTAGLFGAPRSKMPLISQSCWQGLLGVLVLVAFWERAEQLSRGGGSGEKVRRCVPGKAWPLAAPSPDSFLDGIVCNGIKLNWSFASARVGAMKNPLQAVLLRLSSLLWGTDRHISGGLLFAQLGKYHMHTQKVIEESWPPEFFFQKAFPVPRCHWLFQEAVWQTELPCLPSASGFEMHP